MIISIGSSYDAISFFIKNAYIFDIISIKLFHVRMPLYKETCLDRHRLRKSINYNYVVALLYC